MTNLCDGRTFLRHTWVILLKRPMKPLNFIRKKTPWTLIGDIARPHKILVKECTMYFRHVFLTMKLLNYLFITACIDDVEEYLCLLLCKPNHPSSNYLKSLKNKVWINGSLHTKELQGHEFAKTLDIRLCMIKLDSHITQKFLKIMEVEMGRGCWKFP